jgi:hypothetical protein
MKPKSELILYPTEDNRTRIEVRLENETVWLSLNQLAELFQRDKSVISKHIRNVFEEGKLPPAATVAKYATVRTEGARTVSRRWIVAPRGSMTLRLEGRPAGTSNSLSPEVQRRRPLSHGQFGRVVETGCPLMNRRPDGPVGLKGDRYSFVHRRNFPSVDSNVRAYTEPVSAAHLTLPGQTRGEGDHWNAPGRQELPSATDHESAQAARGPR